MVHVVAENPVGFDGGDDSGDRVVPAAEPVQQLGLLVVGPISGGGDRGRVRVDPAVLERLGAPEGAAAPGLVRGEGLPGRGDDEAPSGEAGVRRSGVGGEEQGAYGRVDAIGADDEVGLDVPGRRRDHGAGAADGARVEEFRRRPGTDGGCGQFGGDDIDQGGAVHQDDRAAEPLGRGGAVGPGEPAAVRSAHTAVALPGGQGPDPVTEADHVQGALGVGREADACRRRAPGRRPAPGR